MYDKVEWPLNVLQTRFCYLFFSRVFIKNKAKTIQEVNLQRLTQKYRKIMVKLVKIVPEKIEKDGNWKINALKKIVERKGMKRLF